MILSKTRFDELRSGNQLKIALVGMSNSGKSTTTNVLQREAHFAKFEVDEAINGSLGIDNMDAAAEWMGYPFDDRYADRKREYLELEARFTRLEIPVGRNFVLDTTGSVIYTDTELHDWMRGQFLIVGLEVSTALLEQLERDYFTQPKTVVWRDEFTQLPNETGRAALCRCYPQLLENRSVEYHALSDVMIPSELARSPQLTADDFFAAVRFRLPNKIA